MLKNVKMNKKSIVKTTCKKMGMKEKIIKDLSKNIEKSWKDLSKQMKNLLL